MSPADTAAFGRALGARLQPGDAVLLSGPLGIGKTTLARGLIHGLVGAPITVPSPTFTLVQSYDTPRGLLNHYDLYRLESPDESQELGLLESLADAITLIEWPERLGPYTPAQALTVALDAAAGTSGREVACFGSDPWPARLASLTQTLGHP